MIMPNLISNHGTIRGLWQCTLCKLNKTFFENKEDFEFHLRSFCHICDEEFTSTLCWDVHHQTVHFSNHTELMISAQRSGQRGSYYCCNCGHMFIVEAAFQAHMNKYKNFQCIGCFKTFSEFSDWCSHSNLCQISWKEMVLIEIARECFGCFLQFPSSSDRQRHYQSCNYAISRDARITKMSKERIMKGIVDGLSLQEQILKSRKASTLLIKVPSDMAKSLQIPALKSRYFRKEDLVQDTGEESFLGQNSNDNREIGNCTLQSIGRQGPSQPNISMTSSIPVTVADSNTVLNGAKRLGSKGIEKYSKRPIETCSSLSHNSSSEMFAKKPRATLTQMSRNREDGFSPQVNGHSYPKRINAIQSSNSQTQENEPMMRY